MVRTAATAVRVSGGKSAKAVRNSAPSTSGLQSSRNSGSIGGNPPAHRETPAWQKPITRFFRKTEGAESTTLPTSIATEKENIPNTSSKSTFQEENDEITKCAPNKDTDDAINKLGEECRPQTSGCSENKSESQDKIEREDKSKNKSESENKENKNHNNNTDNDFQKRKTTRDEDDENLLPTKKPRIDYRNLEAIEKFAS